MIYIVLNFFFRILKEKEDDEIEKVFYLEDGVKKKKGGCCSWCLKKD